MPIPVEVSVIQRNGDRIERLGGMWRDRPWSMSAENMIREIERLDDLRQWDFFVMVAGRPMPVIVSSESGHKHLTAADRPYALMSLTVVERLFADGYDGLI
jgi:hypothetical protein